MSDNLRVLRVVRGSIPTVLYNMSLPSYAGELEITPATPATPANLRYTYTGIASLGVAAGFLFCMTHQLLSLL